MSISHFSSGLCLVRARCECFAHAIAEGAYHKTRFDDPEWVRTDCAGSASDHGG